MFYRIDNKYVIKVVRTRSIVLFGLKPPVSNLWNIITTKFGRITHTLQDRHRFILRHVSLIQPVADRQNARFRWHT